MNQKTRVVLFIFVLFGLVGVIPSLATGQSYLSWLEVEWSTSDGGDADGINGPHAVRVSPDGENVYVAGSVGDSIGTFRRDSDDGGRLVYVDTLFDGVNGVDGLNKATEIAISPDGNHVYVTGRDDDAIVVLSREEVSGTLSFVEVHRDEENGVDGLDGAHSVIVSPDGKHVYTTGENDDAVAVFERDTVSGTLSFVEVHKDGVAGVVGLDRTREVIVSHDGRHVYVVSHQNAAIVTFKRDETNGQLTFVQAIIDDTLDGAPALLGAESVVISPDDRHVYVASRNEDTVTLFWRDEDDGTLTYINDWRASIGGTASIVTLDGASALGMTPDGRAVLVGTDVADVLHVFMRDEVTGNLFLYEIHEHGGGQVIDGLEYIKSVRLSPDGRNVYVAGSNDNGVAVFGREGELPQVQHAFLPMMQLGE